MALMAAKGEITPMPTCAIFADTQNEPRAVYEYLDWLVTQLPFPVHVVTNGNLGESIVASLRGEKARAAKPPFFVSGGGMLRRQCTAEFKIKPIQHKLSDLIGRKHGARWPRQAVVTRWLGISMDEVQRARPSREPWAENRWPLIELQMTREDCVAWLDKHGYPRPPKSACVFCPSRFVRMHAHGGGARQPQTERRIMSETSGINDRQFLLYAYQNNVEAVRLAEMLVEISHTWDDLVDGDKPVTTEQINRMMWHALANIPSNGFYRNYGHLLLPVMQLAMCNWHVANELEKSPGRAREISHVLRHALGDVLVFMAAIVGDVDWARKVGPEIRLRCQRQPLDEYLKEMEKKHGLPV